MTLIAKPVIDKQFWILQQDKQKVGNIQATDDGYQITMYNKVVNYKTLPMIRRRENIEFEPSPRVKKTCANNVHGYEVTGRVHNAMWDVKNQLPLFTKSVKSKSWFAAGWYRMKQGRDWKTVHHPKLIMLQRYQYQGPFHTREDAEKARGVSAVSK